MLHVWMNIVSTADIAQEDEDTPLGVAILLHGDSASVVQEIDTRLKAIGGKIAKHPVVKSVNTEYEILDVLTDPFDENDRHEHRTGLKLRLYPAYEDGTNVDRDPIEPRAE